jgi:hypothetical protein
LFNINVSSIDYQSKGMVSGNTLLKRGGMTGIGQEYLRKSYQADGLKWRLAEVTSSIKAPVFQMLGHSAVKGQAEASAIRFSPTPLPDSRDE